MSHLLTSAICNEGCLYSSHKCFLENSHEQGETEGGSAWGELCRPRNSMCKGPEAFRERSEGTWGIVKGGRSLKAVGGVWM